MNVDTDTQWAYWDGLRGFYKKNEGYLQGQVCSPLIVCMRCNSTFIYRSATPTVLTSPTRSSTTPGCGSGRRRSRWSNELTKVSSASMGPMSVGTIGQSLHNLIFQPTKTSSESDHDLWSQKNQNSFSLILLCVSEQEIYEYKRITSMLTLMFLVKFRNPVWNIYFWPSGPVAMYVPRMRM